MNESLFWLIAAMTSLVVTGLLFFRRIRFDEALIDRMIDSAAEELCRRRNSSDETEDEVQSDHAQIELIARELNLFFANPKAENGFIRRLSKKKLLSQGGTFFPWQRRKIEREFLDYYEEFKIRLQNSRLGFITIDNFLILKAEAESDIAGVYVLWNRTRQKFYVGQAKRLFQRVGQHLTGHGNGDVYADYRFGDEFMVRLIKLSDTSFESLDEQELYYIELYDAAATGYNRNKGNQNTGGI